MWLRCLKLMCLLGVLVIPVAGTAQVGIPQRLSDFGLMARNYTTNVPTTDRVWFYTKPDGTPLTAGGGVHPSVEWDRQLPPDVRPGPDAMGVAWLKGATGTVKLRIRNYRPITVVGEIAVQALQLKVPNNAGGWDVVSLTVSPTTYEQFYITPGSSQEFTYTYTGPAFAHWPRNS